MEITPELVGHMAELSRLELSPEEVQKTAAELGRVLAYMDALDRLDAGGVEPLSHVFPVRNVLREDEVSPSQNRGALLAGAPASDGEMFLAPRAVE